MPSFDIVSKIKQGKIPIFQSHVEGRISLDFVQSTLQLEL